MNAYRPINMESRMAYASSGRCLIQHGFTSKGFLFLKWLPESCAMMIGG